MEKGESAAVNFEANQKDEKKTPANATGGNASAFLQVPARRSKKGTMLVDITTLGEDSKPTTRKVELPVAESTLSTDATMEAASTEKDSSSWSAESVKLSNGEETQNEASCTDGKFSCSGSQQWCNEQESTLCDSPHSLRHKHTGRHHHHLKA